MAKEFAVYRDPKPPFPPFPAPLPPRKPCSHTNPCHHQSQSGFLSLLPPEIRNVIYRLVFTHDASSLRRLANHPLDLLLTCHKINHEASALAFATHNFLVSKDFQSGYLTLLTRTQHLSLGQRNVLTTLSFDLGRHYMNQNTGDAATILANALIVFPSLKAFEVHIRRGTVHAVFAHHSSQLTGHTFNDANLDAVEKYAQHWFDYGVLQPAANGNKYAWQKGEKWRIEWPQLKSPFYSLGPGRYLDDTQIPQGSMGTEAIGVERGVHMCVCGCNEVSWLSADLVQETGRRVTIDSVYYGGEERPWRKGDKKEAHLKVRLRPGVQSPQVREGPSIPSLGVTSYGFDADDEYWDALRRQNWKIDALWRGLWSWRFGKQSEEPADEAREHVST